jgi:oligopeptide/dipeptide ABC transporter ATP-binding protein
MIPTSAKGPGDSLLDIRDLTVRFRTERGTLTAIDGISLSVGAGEVLGLVGESGCGKSVTAQAVMRLLDEKGLVDYGGAVLYRGRNLLELTDAAMQDVRGNKLAMVFQDPSSSIDPVYTIGSQIAETIMRHQNLPKRAAWAKAVEMLRLTGIPAPERRVHDYPHEISGGMKQRVMIALALACEPELLIADEPTTALDVTIQAQILDLITDINRSRAMGIVMITHDLGVVAEICTRVAVMYLGQIVEEAPVGQLFDNPRHPYTRGLLRSMPTMQGDRGAELHVIPGTVPSLHAVPAGCRFAARCPHADARCTAEAPPLEVLADGHKVRCWHHHLLPSRKTAAHAS